MLDGFATQLITVKDTTCYCHHSELDDNQNNSMRVIVILFCIGRQPKMMFTM